MDKVLMKQMGADDLLHRQLEEQLCLNLSATHFLLTLFVHHVTYILYQAQYPFYCHIGLCTSHSMC